MAIDQLVPQQGPLCWQLGWATSIGGETTIWSDFTGGVEVLEEQLALPPPPSSEASASHPSKQETSSAASSSSKPRASPSSTSAGAQAWETRESSP